VPQGSILGPLFYIIFTSDLPESIHSHPEIQPIAKKSEDERQFNHFNVNCSTCGNLCCFADDSTYSKSSKDTVVLKQDMDRKYEVIASYMNMNKLVLNSDKTHLLIMCSKQKHRRHANFGITLNTGTEIIEPIETEKLLGGHISSDLEWTNHIKDNEKSLIRLLTSRVNGLMKMCHVSPFRTRKILANGMVMSLMVYLVQLWGGCPDYLLNYLQVIQNKAARHVTKLGCITSTKTLLDQCNWLSVRQLVEYHSLLLVYKVKSNEKPTYLHQKLGQHFSYKTHLASNNGIRKTGHLTHTLTNQSFVHRATRSWNSLPSQLRLSPSLNIFKRELKSWVKTNVELT
jgi:hypothetical protein